VFDGMIFPKGPKPPSLVRRVGGAIIGFFVGRESEKEIVIPAHDDMQEESFRVFLEKYRKLLINLVFSKKITYSLCVGEIYALFLQLRTQTVRPMGYSFASTTRVAAKLSKVQNINDSIIEVVGVG
jgi:hypothetical protein